MSSTTKGIERGQLERSHAVIVNEQIVELSEDAAALVAALACNAEVDQIMAEPAVWDEVRRAFPATLAPKADDADGVIWIGGTE
jgi:hypothetical protein